LPPKGSVRHKAENGILAEVTTEVTETEKQAGETPACTLRAFGPKKPLQRPPPLRLSISSGGGRNGSELAEQYFVLKVAHVFNDETSLGVIYPC